MFYFLKSKKHILKDRIAKEGVGLLLSSGGLKIYFHLGVLKALIDYNIPITKIFGTSAGAIVGGVYAADKDIKRLEDEMMAVDLDQILKLGNPTFSAPGLLKGDPLFDYFRRVTLGKRFEDLLIPFYCNATDLVTARHINFGEKGPLDIAIRASMSIPLIFHPVFLDDKILVDGAVINTIPFDLAKLHWNGVTVVSCLAQAIDDWDLSLKKVNKDNNHFTQLISKHYLALGNLVPHTSKIFVTRKKKDTPEIEANQNKIRKAQIQTLYKKYASYRNVNMVDILFRSWDIVDHNRVHEDVMLNAPDIFINIPNDIDMPIDLKMEKKKIMVKAGYEYAAKSLIEKGL